jgi:aminotransferase
MTDISAFLPLLSPAGTAGGTDDVRFTQYLVKEIGVAVVPGSSFYNEPRDGSRQVRFAFCKKEATLAEAGQRLRRLVG